MLIVRLFLFLLTSVFAAELIAAETDDPHHTDVGFFDMHICNWPDRDPFYRAALTTWLRKEIKQMTIRDPQGRVIGDMDLSRVRVMDRKRRKFQHKLVTHFEMPESMKDGWYQADIVFWDDTLFTTRDYIKHGLLDRAIERTPEADAELDAAPSELSWKAVDGASYYEVYVRDVWNEDKLVFEATRIKSTSIALPKGALKRGGLYRWQLLARDMEMNAKYGDFNLGSKSGWTEFSIK